MLLAHLSDPHLNVGPYAAAPAQGLHRALQRVLALEPRPDAVVITGDLADHGHPEEYDQLRALLDGFPVPVHLVAGNHDQGPALNEAFGDTRYTVEYPGLTLVVLDSRIPGGAEGRLGDEQLGWLEEQLRTHHDGPVAIALHHPPVAVGFPGMDAIRLADGDRLAELVATSGNVHRVLAGHLHRVTTATFAGTTLSVAPSTFRQTDLRLTGGGSIGFADEPTGFLLHLTGADTWVTHLVAVSHAGGRLQGY